MRFVLQGTLGTRMNNPWNRYPFSFMGKRWSRTFFLGFVGLILIMILVDRLLADFEYIRVVDVLIIGAYGLFWTLLYWFRPDFFEDTRIDEMSFPESLLPRPIEDLADRRRVGVVSLVLLGILILVLGDLQNGWSAFLPPVLGPMLMSLFFAWRPPLLFPRFPRHEEMTGEHAALDEAASQFIGLLKSRRAKRILLLTGMSTSASLAVVIWVISFLRGGSLEWTFSIRAILPLTLLFALWSMSLHYHFLLRWALRTGSGRSEH